MDYKTNLDFLLNELDRQNGSDLHFNIGKPPSIRIDGQLFFLENQASITKEDANEYLKLLLSDKELIKFKEVFDLDFSFNTDTFRLRGNAYIENENPGIVLRRVPDVKSLDQLQLPEILKSFALAKQGFFLVVGPTGQGKSTTMAAMIEEINVKTTSHIVTIEDPIEFHFESKNSIIDQREVGRDTVSFEAGLKSVFREDVNVILIGEMRTYETMSAAVTAAETGHLVISTLHTNNAPQTIDRIIDSFPSEQQGQIRLQLASSLIGVLSQRLIPKIKGGRAMAYELLVVTPAVSNLIREKRTHEIPVLIETGSEHGMVDMNNTLLELIKQGEISFDTAIQYSLNPETLRIRYQ